MKISVITAWGDEHLLAPYFCSHYAFADEIVVLMGPGTNVETEKACEPYGNVSIREVKYPNDKWDMYVKQDAITKAAHDSVADWVLVVDADEFIFAVDNGFPMKDPRPFLASVEDGNVIMAAMWHVYRHKDDKDLDPAWPPLKQRRHGDPEIEHHYVKPIVVNPKESRIEWHIGAHRYFENEHIRVSSKRFAGVHWHWADADIAVARHRMVSERIIEPQKWLTNATDENLIRARCEAHRNDPRLF